MPEIRGVCPKLTWLLGEHREVAKWDFFEREEGQVSLLVPMRLLIIYAVMMWPLLLLGKDPLFPICLAVEEE